MARPGHRPSDNRKDYIGRFFFDFVVEVVVDVSLGVCVVIVESVVEVDVDVEGVAIGSDIVVEGFDVVEFGEVGIVVVGPVVEGDEPGVAGAVCANAAVDRVRAAIVVRAIVRIGSSPFGS